MAELFRPSPMGPLSLTGHHRTVIFDHGVVDARVGNRLLVSGLYHRQIFNHRVKHDADSSAMENQVLFIHRRNPGFVLSIQGPNHACGSSQRRPFRCVQVMESVDEKIDSWKFNFCKIANHLGSKNVFPHESLRSRYIGQFYLETGDLFNVPTDLVIELEEQQHPLFPIPFALPIGFTPGNRYRQVTCAICFIAQAPNEVRRYRCNSNTDPRHSKSCPCSGSRPGIPPHHTVALTGIHTRADSAPERCHKAPIQKVEIAEKKEKKGKKERNQIHIAPSLKIAGHSAMWFERNEAAHG